MKKVLLMACIAVGIMQGCGDGFKTSDDGLKYKIYTENAGDKIKEGDYVTLQMVYRSDSDSVLFDTYAMGRPVQLIVGKPTFQGDLMHGLMLLTEKDSATFLINADSLFMKTFQMERPQFIGAGSMLTFNIKVDKVRTKEQMEAEMKDAEATQETTQKANIEQYQKEHSLSMTVTESGLHYTIVKPGSGDKVMPGDTVQVKYQGRFLNGKEFDSSNNHGGSIKFAVQRGEVMQGWDEALLLMNKGAKISLVVPFSLGYGARANGPIPAYSTLAFDIELINIIKTK